MKEESVFWLGGKPASRQTAEAPPVPETIEPAVREACRTHGLEPEDFVAALGGFGSWLVHFTRGARRERIVWNGREAKLVLQGAIRSGGWEDLRDCAVAQPDTAGFVAAIGTLMDPAT